jgi:hypothetical protein
MANAEVACEFEIDQGHCLKTGFLVLLIYIGKPNIDENRIK